MRIFVSTGEPSGDLHAANLIRSLRRRLPDAEFVGFGGKHMARAGARVLFPLVDFSVMWFLRVLLNIHVFLRVLRQADRYFRDEKPDVVVMIDYPGFHWWLARKAKKRGIPVVYYVPPQLWAWAGWRAKKVRRFVDLVLCSLPFEPAWYRERGVEGVAYVGHPYFDELADRTVDLSFVAEERTRGGPIVAILPGSRTQELERNLPMMIDAAKELHRDRPDARFLVACLHDRHAGMARGVIEERGAEALPIDVCSGRTPEIIRLADLAWAVSGSVGLELLVEALPSVVVYRVKPFDLWVARKFITTKYISLVNLLADSEVMPEYLCSHDVASDLADWGRTWLGDDAARRNASLRLATLRERVAVPGASDRAAEQVAALLGKGPNVLRGPHDPRSVRTEETGWR